MSIKSIKDIMIDEGDGNLTFSNRIFERQCFDDFSLIPKIGTAMVIEDCSFIGCKITGGSFSILKGAILKNVSFENFDCDAPMHISAEVILENVKITGDKSPAMIWIRPQDDGGSIEKNENLLLDISEYQGEVSITGFPVDCVKINSNYHVTVASDLLNRVDWSGLGFHVFSEWKLMAKKASVEGSVGGIFSMPSKGGKNYERSMRELNILKSNGYM